MNESDFREALKEEFNPRSLYFDAVVQEAMRIKRAGKLEEDFDAEITADFLVSKLKSVDRPLKDSWNWYMGMLASFYDLEYERYQIR